MKKDEFTKSVDFWPGHDGRSNERNTGISAMRIRFVLKGPKGATQFMIGTDWYLPHVQRELEAKGCGDLGARSVVADAKPMGWDIGYHSPVPMWEGQERIGTENCEILGCECYYDGSSLRADEFIPEFLQGGSEAVWEMLEREYRERFDSKSPAEEVAE